MDYENLRKKLIVAFWILGAVGWGCAMTGVNPVVIYGLIIGTVLIWIVCLITYWIDYQKRN